MKKRISNHINPVHFSYKALLLSAMLGGAGLVYGGTWQPLTHQPHFTGGSPGQTSPLGTLLCSTNGKPTNLPPCNGGVIGQPGQPGVMYGQGAVAPILLTDGSVLVIDTVLGPVTKKQFPLYSYIAYGDVWKLTPDINGSYVNGTWKQVASFPKGYAPVDFASAILPDGRLIIMGGEENFIDFTYTATGVIYDPVADTWTAVPPPPFFTPDKFDILYYDLYFNKNVLFPLQQYNVNGQMVTLTVGDASSVVLPEDKGNGQFMVANTLGYNAALLKITKGQNGQPETYSWTEVAKNGKFDTNSEEGWTLLPNGKILTIDTYISQQGVGIFCPSFITTCNTYPYQPYPVSATNSEIYDPATDTWTTAGSTLNSLTDNQLEETGTAALRPDGTVWATGSSVFGNTSFYDSKTGVWTVGPKFPYISDVVNGSAVGQLGASDGPASLLPNGNVLVAASNGFTAGPLYFFELDRQNNLITQPTVPNTLIDSSGDTYLLLLPNGQVMLADFTPDVEIYTPSNQNYDPNWAPVIDSNGYTSKLQPGGTYSISGIRFNGMSQANFFGDDYQAATNFPLVRIKNKYTNHVFYCRTHDFSWMGVADSTRTVTANFDVPANIEAGPGNLVVVTNGIPSAPVSVNVKL